MVLSLTVALVAVAELITFDMRLVMVRFVAAALLVGVALV